MHTRIIEIAKENKLNVEPQHQGGFPNDGFIIVERFSSDIIAECARLIDTWHDSGRYATFGERLVAYFKEENDKVTNTD